MPKKTKKEKLLAMYHRKLRLLEDREVVVPVSTLTSVFNNKTIPVIIQPVNQYFFSDLKKSLLLIVLILGIEVGLYFTKLIK